MRRMAIRWGGRALFIGLHVGLIALAWVLVIAPVQLMLAERTEEIAGRRAVLARYQAIAAQAETAGAFVRAVRERNARGGLLEGGSEVGSEGAASAGLQARLKAAAEGEGAVVRSVRGLPGRPLGGGSMIGARVELAGSVGVVAKFVQGIENGQALLVVTAASLRPRAEERIASAEAPLIDAQLDIYGGSLPGGTGSERDLRKEVAP